MPYLTGVLTGIVLTILAVFLIDHFGSEPNSRMIVNWTVLAERVGAVKEEVRKDVHEATAPEARRARRRPPPFRPRRPRPTDLGEGLK
jgi:hypothetical protein